MGYAIDLFCGAGGCSEGLIQAGFHILFSSDISPMVEKTYTNRHNQLGLIQGVNTWFERSDIRDLTGDIIRDRIMNLQIFKDTPDFVDIDLMIGGPSCQGFSRCGKRDKTDPRNMLFGEYVRVINQIRPKYVVLENVEGFMDMEFLSYRGLDILDNGHVISEGPVYPDGTTTPVILTSELNRIGYSTLEPRILNAADFGVPQRRHRVIFIAYRGDVNVPSYPTPTHVDNHVSIAEAIGDLITDEETRARVNPDITAYQHDSMRGRTPHFGTHEPIKAEELTCTELPKMSDIVSERFSLFRQGESGAQLRRRLREEGVNLSGKDSLFQLIKDNETLDFVVETAKNTSHFKVSEAFLDVLLTKKSIRQRLSETEPSPTVVTIPDDYISPWEDRTFSVRELARLQSFDDSFEFLGKRTTGGLNRRVEVPQYTQVGNAVPPLLAKAIAEEILRVL